MNLPVASNNKQKVFGFTLVEVMLVMALTFVVGVFVSPVGVSFYKSQLLNETSDGLVSALREAQSLSMSGKDNQAFGIYMGEGEYVVFTGDTYASRIVSEDLVFPFATSVSITGPSEVTFSKLTGEPSYEGALIVSLGDKERRIEILGSGNIDR